MLTRNNFRARISRLGPEVRPRNFRLPLIYRFLADPGPKQEGEGPLRRDAKLAKLEAVLFAADEPLNLRRLAGVLDQVDTRETRKLLKKLQALYQEDGTAFQIEELAGGYQLLTTPEFFPWLVRVRKTTTELKLSVSARETLAIVAFRQPITRADLEAIRGVQSNEVLRQLMEKGLIRIAGRDESLGRPVLYGTTKKFLQGFGLRSLDDLPQTTSLPQPPLPSKSEKAQETTELPVSPEPDPRCQASEDAFSPLKFPEFLVDNSKDDKIGEEGV